jgi:hypothetical protein
MVLSVISSVLAIQQYGNNITTRLRVLGDIGETGNREQGLEGR